MHTSSSIVVYKGQGNGTLATSAMATISGFFDHVRVGDAGNVGANIGFT